MLQPKTCVAFVPTLNNSLRPDDPPVPRCQECIKKQSGFVCCFKDVRSFPLDQQGRPLPFPVFHDSSDRDEEPLFPTEYNEPFTIVAAAILKTTCADALLPSLKRELAHSELPRSVRLRRQLGTTYTCDGCAASFLCGSWMCRTCGREYCLDCLEVIKQLPIEEIREHSRNHRTFHQGLNGSMAGLNVNTVDKLTRCVFLERHGPEEHIPVIRLERPELRRIVDEMTVWRKTHAVPKPVSLSPDWIEHYRFCPDAKENSLPYLRLPGQLVPPVLDADHPLIDLSPSTSGHSSVSPTTAPTKTALPPDFDRSSRTSLPASLQSTLGSLAMTPVRDYNSAGASTLLPPYQQVRLPAADITQHDLFHALWSLGEPLVIDLAPEHYPSLPWTPTFFIQRFGQHACTVGSNRVKQVLRDGSLADRERTSTVAEFFETFGKTRDGSDIEKIKVSLRSLSSPTSWAPQLTIPTYRTGPARATSRRSTRSCGKMFVLPCPSSCESSEIDTAPPSNPLISSWLSSPLDRPLAVTASSTSLLTRRLPRTRQISGRRATSARRPTTVPVEAEVQNCTVCPLYKVFAPVTHKLTPLFLFLRSGKSLSSGRHQPFICTYLLPLYPSRHSCRTSLMVSHA